MIDGHIDLPDVHKDSRARYLKEMLNWHKMGHKHGRTLLITAQERPAMTEVFEDEVARWEAELLKASDVDVKDLLELGHLMIEKEALDNILYTHQKDLSGDARIENFKSFWRSRRWASQLTVTSASPTS